MSSLAEAKSRKAEGDRTARSARDTGTLGKVVALLDIVAQASRPPRFTDILRESGQPRGTLHRQLSNLVDEGLLTLRPDQSYEPGLRLLTFASRAWAGNEFRAVAEPHLERLHEATGETVHLAVLRGAAVIYLDKVEGHQALRMHSQIGNASPAYCTGVGKAALSVLAPDDLEKRIAATHFERHTERTIMTPDALRTEIAAIRESGVAYDCEEHEPGISCVAAPVHSSSRNLVAALSVTGPAFRISRAQFEGWAGVVRRTAQDIMDDLEPRLGPRG